MLIMLLALGWPPENISVCKAHPLFSGSTQSEGYRARTAIEVFAKSNGKLGNRATDTLRGERNASQTKL